MKRPKLPEDWLLQRMPENTWNVTGHIVARNEAIAMVKGEAAAKAIVALPALLEALEGMHAWLTAPDMSPDSLKWAQEKTKSALIAAGYTL